MSATLGLMMLAQVATSAAAPVLDAAKQNIEEARPEDKQESDRPKTGGNQPPGLFDTLFGATRDAVRIEADQGPASDQLNLARLLAGTHELSATLSLYPNGQSWCVPATAFLDALEVAHAETASALQVTLYEPLRRHSLPLSQLGASPDGPCMDLEDAGRLTESDLTYDPGTLELHLSRGDHLPAVRRIEREATRTARMGPKEDGEPSYPTLANPWRLAGLPTVDLAVQGGLSAGKARFSMLAEGAGDLLWSTARWRMSLDQGGAIRFSGHLEHVAPEGGILGPLDARRIELGDVSAPSQPLIASASQVRGLIVSSAPEWRAEIFDRIVIEGPLGQGWRAELMIDGRLAGYVDGPDETGSYRFQDVPLKTGINRFVVEMYGPHGERDRREIIRQVGSALFAENETAFTFGLVGSSSGGTAPSEGSLAQAPAAAFATISTGLSDWVSLRTDVRQALTSSANGAGFTLDASMFGGGLALSFAHRSPGGMAYAAAYSRRLGTWSASAELRDNGPQPSAWDLGIERDARRSGQIDVSGPLVLGGVPLAIAFGAENSITRQGTKRNSIKLGGTARLGRLRFNNDLAIDLSPQRQTFGALSAQWTRANASLRTFVNYEVAKGLSMQSIGATFGSNQNRLSYIVSGTYDFAGAGPATSIGVNYRWGTVDLAAEAGWSKSSGTAVSLVARFALGQIAEKRSHFLPSGSSRVGTLVPRLTDENNEAVTGGRYLVANSLRAETGDSDGVTSIGGLPTNRPVSLSLQLSSLDDDRLRPEAEGAQISLRPGQVFPVPIKLAPTGTIEIRLVHGSGERQDPVAGLAVILTSSTGRVFQAQSDFDGYALFSGLPFGDYIARASFGSVSRQQTITVKRDADDVSIPLRF